MKTRVDEYVADLCDALYENDGELSHYEVVKRFGLDVLKRAESFGRVTLEGEGRLTTVYLVVDQEQWLQ